MTTTTITYQELAKRLDALKLFNKAPELDPNFWYEGLENGTIDYCIEHDESERNKCLESDCEFENHEVYQWYLISPSDAEYIKDHTNELIFYSDAWSDVELEFTE
jgi:hypothetical protein